VTASRSISFSMGPTSHHSPRQLRPHQPGRFTRSMPSRCVSTLRSPAVRGSTLASGNHSTSGWRRWRRKRGIRSRAPAWPCLTGPAGEMVKGDEAFTRPSCGKRKNTGPYFLFLRQRVRRLSPHFTNHRQPAGYDPCEGGLLNSTPTSRHENDFFGVRHVSFSNTRRTRVPRCRRSAGGSRLLWGQQRETCRW